MATRISSLVTPRHVAPPLSPFQYGTQGGDCGSSIWRGGAPMHRRTRATSTGGFASDGATLEVVVVAAGPAPPPPPSPAPPEPPPPEPNWLDCSVGACLICSVACGANSAMEGGGGWRVV